MKSQTLKSLKTLVVILAVCIVGGFGACGAGLMGLSYLSNRKPIELSHSTTVDQLLKACGEIETSSVNHASWVTPRCVTGQHLEVVFNQKTRKLMEWKTKFGNNRSEATTISLKLSKKTTIGELRKRCGKPVEEKTGYARWEHPDCEVIKQLEVAFDPKSGTVRESKKFTFDGKKLTSWLDTSKKKTL